MINKNEYTLSHMIWFYKMSSCVRSFEIGIVHFYYNIEMKVNMQHSQFQGLCIGHAHLHLIVTFIKNLHFTYDHILYLKVLFNTTYICLSIMIPYSQSIILPSFVNTKSQRHPLTTFLRQSLTVRNIKQSYLKHCTILKTSIWLIS